MGTASPRCPSTTLTLQMRKLRPRKGVRGSCPTGPWELVAWPKLQSRRSDSQARGFSHSPSMLWPGSTESPKATNSKSSGAWKWGDSPSGFLGHPLPISEGGTGRCPCVESQEQGEAPQGTWARVTQGPKSPSWRDLTPKVKGHRQGRVGRLWGSEGQR